MHKLKCSQLLKTCIKGIYAKLGIADYDKVLLQDKGNSSESFWSYAPFYLKKISKMMAPDRRALVLHEVLLLTYLSTQYSRWAFVMVHCLLSVVSCTISFFLRKHLLYYLMDFDLTSQVWSLGKPISKYMYLLPWPLGSNWLHSEGLIISYCEIFKKNLIRYRA